MTKDNKHSNYWIYGIDKDDWLDGWLDEKGYPGKSYHDRKEVEMELKL